MTLDQIYEWVREQIDREVEKWFTAQCQNLHGEYYLYHKQGDIRIAEELSPEDGWQLSSPHRISTAMDKTQVKYLALEILRKCPCLPVNS